MARRLFIGSFVLVGVLAALYLQEAYRGINDLAAADTWAYWSVDPAHPYDGRRSGEGSGVFLYSPAAAQVMSLLRLLPWEFVRDAWGFGQVVLLAVLAGPFTGPLLLTRPVQWELLLGNISLLLAAVSVAGLRWPALWSIAILTKVTPGIGLLWFVARREWRNLGIAAAATAVIVVLSFALAPGLWLEWAGVLVANQAIAPNPDFWTPPFLVRVAFAAALIWYGARRGWRWVVPVAVMLSTAHLWAYAVTPTIGALWWAWRGPWSLGIVPYVQRTEAWSPLRAGVKRLRKEVVPARAVHRA